jgi:hypothetical protein
MKPEAGGTLLCFGKMLAVRRIRSMKLRSGRLKAR